MKGEIAGAGWFPADDEAIAALDIDAFQVSPAYSPKVDRVSAAAEERVDQMKAQIAEVQEKVAGLDPDAAPRGGSARLQRSLALTAA